MSSCGYSALFVVCDSDGRIIDGGGQISEFSGKPLERLMGARYWEELLPPSAHEREAERFSSLSSGSGRLSYESRWLKSDGSQCTCKVDSLLCGVPGSPSFAVIVAVPCPAGLSECCPLVDEERRRLEKLLLDSVRADAFGRLTHGIAHEFNNILSPIIGYTELAKAELGPGSPVLPDLERVREAALRARDLVRSLVVFTGDGEFSLETVDLNGIVRSFVHLARNVLCDDIEITTRLQPSLEPVNADRALVEQAMMCLALNAREAMPSGGRIVIETGIVSGEELDGADAEHQGRYCAVTMKDDGVSFDADMLPRLFELGVPSSGRRRAGLCLVTVKRIMEYHGGWVVCSPSAKGASFTLYFPGTGENPDPGRETAVRREGGFILVVEDDAMVRKLVSDALSLVGHQVLSCAAPSEALEAAENLDSPPDLLFTDVILPGMNGRDLYGRLSARWKDLDVVYCSGYPDNVLLASGVGTGECAVMLKKPFSVEELRKLVSERLERLRSRRDETV